MLLGLRGTGKTVLLTRIESLAKEHGVLSSFIEAPEGERLPDLLYPKLVQVLKHLSGIEAAKAAAHGALKALRGFAAAFKVSVASISIEVDPEPGTADSGNLEHDLVDLFDRVGRAAKAANKAWVLLIDEVQYLSSSDLSALIVALHAINRSNLPVLMFGAGLPQIAAMSGDAKSYAERLFLFRRIDALDETAASEAIRQPIQEEDGRIDDDALAHIFQQTRGYPYFLQEWGFQIWNLAETWPFTLQDARNASHAALQRMDESLFSRPVRPTDAQGARLCARHGGPRVRPVSQRRGCARARRNASDAGPAAGGHYPQGHGV